MIRALIFLLSAIFVAGLTTWLVTMQSFLVVQIFGREISTPAGLALGAAILGALATIGGTLFIRRLVTAPGRMRRRMRDDARERGIEAIARGLEAVAVGAASDAAHHSRVARRNLGDGSLTRLLTAQAAELSGDIDAARDGFTRMLEAPETEFLGLRGLYQIAVDGGDLEAARRHAERAYALRPTADWAFDSVFDLALRRGAWREAREALGQARRNKLIDNDAAARAEAALLTADSFAAAAAADHSTAVEDAEKALALSPGLAPAALIAADLHARGGRPDKASKVLERAFATAPNRGLFEAYAALHRDDAPDAMARRLDKLAAKAGDDRLAAVARAPARILSGDFRQAIEILEPQLERSAPAGDCALMARAIEGANGPDAAHIWLQRAASAPRDITADLAAFQRLPRDAWAGLVREFRDHGRLWPTRLDIEPEGIPASELKLLTAPASPADTTAETIEPDSAPEDIPVVNNEDRPASDHRTEPVDDKNEEMALKRGADAEAAARSVS